MVNNGYVIPDQEEMQMDMCPQPWRSGDSWKQLSRMIYMLWLDLSIIENSELGTIVDQFNATDNNG